MNIHEYQAKALLKQPPFVVKAQVHAGAIVNGNQGTATAKIEAMRECGIHVCEDLSTIGGLCALTFQVN